MINVSRTSRETLGPPGWSRYMQKVNLALPFFEELQFELLSIADSLSLDPQKWSKENPPHAMDIFFWISSEDVSATEMIQSPDPHESWGQQVCLLRYKRICFSARLGTSTWLSVPIYTRRQAAVPVERESKSQGVRTYETWMWQLLLSAVVNCLGKFNPSPGPGGGHPCGPGSPMWMALELSLISFRWKWSIILSCSLIRYSRCSWLVECFTVFGCYHPQRHSVSPLLCYFFICLRGKGPG